jgi:hypothetical protein
MSAKHQHIFKKMSLKMNKNKRTTYCTAVGLTSEEALECPLLAVVHNPFPLIVLPLALLECCPLLLPVDAEECVSGTRTMDPGVGLVSKPRAEEVVDGGPEDDTEAELLLLVVLEDPSSFFVELEGEEEFPLFADEGSFIGIAKNKIEIITFHPLVCII